MQHPAASRAAAIAGEHHLFQVEAGHDGQRLDQYLARALEPMSRAAVQGLIKAGRVTVNNTVAGRAAQRLRTGDRVAVEVPPPEPLELRPEPVDFTILHEDADIVVVDKPAGLVVHPGAGHQRQTLVHGLLHACQGLAGIGGVERPGIVHRLDRDTSGVMVVAKHDGAHQALVAQFKARTVAKTYLALVHGIPPDHGRCQGGIGRHPVDRKRMAIREDGRPAVTDYRCRRVFREAALVEAHPRTGRTHQIRVHLAGMGHPIVGDPVYGRKGGSGGVTAPRLFLHALALEFTHPGDGGRVRFTAPLPPELVAVLRGLAAGDGSRG